MNMKKVFTTVTGVVLIMTLSACGKKDQLDGNVYVLEGFNGLVKTLYFENGEAYDIEVISQPAPILDYEISNEHLVLTNGRHYFYLTYDDLSQDTISGVVEDIEETELDYAEPDFEFTADALGIEYSLEKTESEREITLPDL